MGNPKHDSALQLEQKKLSKPVGSKRFLSWILGLPTLLAFLVLPWLAAEHPAVFEQIVPNVHLIKEPTQLSNHHSIIAPPNNAHPSLTHSESGDTPERLHTALSLDAVWNPGPVDSVHQAWAYDCQACHVGNFQRVQNQSCESCHGNMGLHVNEQTLPDTQFSEPNCATCHRDHKGLSSLAQQNKHFVGEDCATCHSEILKTAPNTLTLPVSGFDPEQHPNFRVTVRPQDESVDLIRVRLEKNQPLQEPTTLKFPHHVHLDPKGLQGKTEIEILGCADCHEPADTQTGFLPITMEAHCQNCHSLAFEPALPEREVPHGASGPVLDTIVEFYSFMALNRNLRDEVKTARATLLARPGTEKKPPRVAVTANPLVQAEAAAKDLFENRACAVCHEVSISSTPLTVETSGSMLTQFQVEPVPATHTWMPYAKFNHAAHEFESCESCHSAKQSESAEDVLMPAIDNCQTCHTSNKDVIDQVTSNCGVCHNYHIHDQNTLNTQSEPSTKLVDAAMPIAPN